MVGARADRELLAAFETVERWHSGGVLKAYGEWSPAYRSILPNAATRRAAAPMSRAARTFGMRLEVSDIQVERGGRRILDGLSFALAPGEALIVTGPNGAGKSTLLRVLAGLLPLKQGRIAIGGAEDPAALRRARALRRSRRRQQGEPDGGGESVVLGGDAEIAAGQGNELAAGGSACRFCAGARERSSRRGFIGRPETARGAGAAARRAAADLAARRAAERARRGLAGAALASDARPSRPRRHDRRCDAWRARSAECAANGAEAVA